LSFKGGGFGVRVSAKSIGGKKKLSGKNEDLRWAGGAAWILVTEKKITFLSQKEKERKGLTGDHTKEGELSRISSKRALRRGRQDRDP